MNQLEKVQMLKAFDFSDAEIERVIKTNNLDNVVEELKKWKKKMKSNAPVDMDNYSEEYQDWKYNVLGDSPGHSGHGMPR
ncbi:hypothetical protein HZB01_03450 [Candidatus Woesearchaeota archaeon]|nr:hypothetical protein [Candidatus Woesearchaeota archaeon]